MALNVTGRSMSRTLDSNRRQRAVVYDGSGMLGVAQFYQELTRRIEALPGVVSAGSTSAAPLNTGRFPPRLALFL